MGENDLKVTDKRMFTADGELREEYRHLERKTGTAEPAAAAEPEPAPQEPTDATPEKRPVPPVKEPPSQAAEPPAIPVAESPAGDSGRAGADPDPAGAEPPGRSPRLEIPDTPDSLGTPTFLDLVGMLVEPVALYLGDATLPDGESAENLPMARLHIDLLDLLREKTAGNLTAQESSVLEDLLYRCRLRYVQKRG